MDTAIDVIDVVKKYLVGDTHVLALDNLRLDIEYGDFVAISGRSGSGKTTLLHLLGGIARPTSGRVRTGGTDLQTLSEADLVAWRRRSVGMVLQFFHLEPNLTVCENVALAMGTAGGACTAKQLRGARELLGRMGIADEAARLPGMLSAGQQRRVAVAQALANDPPVVLADEPTANLDPNSAGEMLDLFMDLNYAGRTIVLVTHEPSIQATVKREITLDAGRVIRDHRVMPVQG